MFESVMIAVYVIVGIVTAATTALFVALLMAEKKSNPVIACFVSVAVGIVGGALWLPILVFTVPMFIAEVKRCEAEATL